MFNTSVESVAKKFLFYHVVNTDHDAVEILDKFNKMQLDGELNFIALNRLKNKVYEYPQSKDFVPLIQHLEYTDQLKPAVNFIFGNKILCKNLDVPLKYTMLKERFTWVTYDGDLFNHDGSISGGYINELDSKISLFMNFKSIMVYCSELNIKIDQIKKNAEEIESDINDKITVILKLEKTKQRMGESVSHYQSQIKEKETKLKISLESWNNIQLDLESIKSSLKFDCENLESTEKSLSEKNFNYEAYQKDLQNLLCQIDSVHSSCVKLTAEKNSLQTIIEQHTANLETLDSENKNIQNISQKFSACLLDADTISDLKRELNLLCGELSDKESTLRNIDTQLETFKNEDENLKKELAELKFKLSNLEKSDSEKEESCNKILAQLNNLKSRKLDLNTKLSALGYYNVTFDDVSDVFDTNIYFNKLKAIQEELKNYKNINSNISNVLKDFLSTKQHIEKKLAKIEEEKKSIEHLRSKVDQEKSSSIYITFKQISLNFTEIFKQLVPAGQASIVIKTQPGAAQPSDSATQQSQPFSNEGDLPPVDQITGIGIKVSFDSESSVMNIDQLSGGQKSIVALGLIFAIQKCDPAPVYLFDEIDAALDEQYRENVATLIKNLSQSSQFITISFMPQLLEAAEKIFFITQEGKSSNVKEISFENALDFVTNRDQI
ncbi:MAG: Structural maintenance of chromosomes protein 3 [Paramarteilia canceri]